MRHGYSLVLTAFALLLSVSDAFARGNVPYVYVAQRGELGSTTISIGTEPAAVYIGHAGRKATFCPANALLYCVESVAFNFHVPKGALHNGQDWKWNGFSYRVVNEVVLELLGVRVDAYVIGVRRGQESSAFYYSLENGLVAFLAHGRQGEEALYLLKGRFGFPVLNIRGDKVPHSNLREVDHR